jgi:O-antigen/teichoic acid export membrane protein
LGFYGDDFVEGKYALIFLCFAAVFMAMNNVIGQALASVGKMWQGFLFNSLWAVALVLGTYCLLAYGYGAMGLALAILMAYIMHSFWQGLYLYRVVQPGK